MGATAQARSCNCRLCSSASFSVQEALTYLFWCTKPFAVELTKEKAVLSAQRVQETGQLSGQLPHQNLSAWRHAPNQVNFSALSRAFSLATFCSTEGLIGEFDLIFSCVVRELSEKG